MFITKTIMALYKLLSLVTDRIYGPIKAEHQIDWDNVEKTRRRLVQMRFRQDSMQISHTLDLDGVRRRIKDSTDKRAEGISLRERDRRSMTRWFAKEEESSQTFEKELETTLKERWRSQMEADYWTDETTSGTYDGLALPGIKYAVDPDLPRLLVMENCLIEEEIDCSPSGKIDFTPSKPVEVKPLRAIEQKPKALIGTVQDLALPQVAQAVS